MEEYEEANQCYDSLIKLNSYNSDYWINRASNLICMKRFDDAIDCLDDAISLYPCESFYLLKGKALELKEMGL